MLATVDTESKIMNQWLIGSEAIYNTAMEIALQHLADVILFFAIVALWLRTIWFKRRLVRMETKMADASRLIDGLDIQMQRLFLVGLRDSSTVKPARRDTEQG